MDDSKGGITLDIFNEPTTYRNDYVPKINRRAYKHRWLPTGHPKPPPEPQPVVWQCHETFRDNKKYIPFDYCWRHHRVRASSERVKELLAQNEVGHEEAIKMRPRVVLPTASSLDDFPPEERKLVVENIYKSVTHKSLDDSVKFTVKDVSGDGKTFTGFTNLISNKKYF